MELWQEVTIGLAVALSVSGAVIAVRDTTIGRWFRHRGRG
jgi:hypothetical protein